MYNFISNSDTKVSLYFSSANSHVVTTSGVECKAEFFAKMTKWFPDLTIEQIQKHVNVLSFLVETLPPNENLDVELSKHNRVMSWKLFNCKKVKLILLPIDGG